MTLHTGFTTTPEEGADHLTMAHYWVGVAEDVYAAARDETGYAKAQAAAKISIAHVALYDVSPAIVSVDAYGELGPTGRQLTEQKASTVGVFEVR